MTSMSMALREPALQISDEALAAAARDGDRDAFDLLMARYRGLVYSYALIWVNDRDEAEDLTQEAFVRAFSSLPRFRTNACWGAWLMRILRNLCHDAHRRKSVRRSQPIDSSLNLQDDRPTPELQLLAGDQLSRLTSAVENLPDKLRVPLLLHYSAGRTYQEIALALDLPHSTIVGRLAGALRLLRRQLAEDAV